MNNAAIDFMSPRWNRGSRDTASSLSDADTTPVGSFATAIDDRDLLAGTRLPAWFYDALMDLSDIISMEAGWDTYGAPAIKSDFVKHALIVLAQISTNRTPRPAIVPTSSGHIQLEWHTATSDLEIEVLSATDLDVYYSNDITSEEWEGRLNYDLSVLDRYMRELEE